MKKVLILLIFLSFSLTATGNPFLSRSKKSPDKEQPKTIELVETTEQTSFGHLKQRLVSLQKETHKTLSAAIKDVSVNRKIAPLLFAFLFAFLYGILHAIGPGHGKVIALSYFLRSSQGWKKGIFFGYLVAAIHALSAVIIISSLTALLTGSTMSEFEQTSDLLKRVSFAAIILTGVTLLFLQFRAHNRPQAKKKETRSLPMLALAVGIVPCPGTTLILLFSSALKVYSFGLILAGFMALGMGTTIAAVAAGTAFLREKGTKTGESSRFQEVVHTLLETGSAVLIILIGVLLFFSV
ncbi:hypothetical protein KAH37_00925 [bacterium]|nr:hypothetical protein [bacterium]